MSGAEKQAIKELRYQLERDGLTLRQRQVVELVLRGLSNKEIGRLLFITEKTVKHHLGLAMTNLRLEIRTRDFICHIFGHYLKPPPNVGMKTPFGTMKEFIRGKF